MHLDPLYFLSVNKRKKANRHAVTDPSSQDRIQIGWREVIALPDWGIDRLRVKVDSGARTSAIHVASFEQRDDGTARFEVVIQERPDRRVVWVEAPLIREAVVKPSSGKRQRRPVVQTTMHLGGVEKTIELTLVCRKGMLCRMLLGRTAMGEDFLIDTSRKYLASKAPKRRKKH